MKPKQNTASAVAHDAEPPAIDPAARHQRVEIAIDNFVAGQATDDDLDIFRNHAYMRTASALQACRFIKSAMGRTVNFDVFATWSGVLRQRYLQSLSGRRNGGSNLPRDLVEVPADPLSDDVS